MARYTLTHTRLKEGIWEAVVTMRAPKDQPPQIGVTHQDRPLEGVTLQATETAGDWLLCVPVPAALIADGVQTFVISDLTDEAVLDSFSLICGDAVGHDIRAELDLLRAELDLLKRAFRRHCVETQAASI